MVFLSNLSSVKGKVVHARDSQTPVYAFLGMPFAVPPVGKLRFQKPQSIILQSGLRDATQFGMVRIVVVTILYKSEILL